MYRDGSNILSRYPSLVGIDCFVLPCGTRAMGDRLFNSLQSALAKIFDFTCLGKIILPNFVHTMVMSYTCPICSSNDLVEINESLIRESDILLHENEEYQHLLRGRINLLVHTKNNVNAEHLLPSSYTFDKLAIA